MSRPSLITSNDIQVIDLLLEGKKQAEIAKMLGVTIFSIRNALQRIGKKLQIDCKLYNLEVRIVYLAARQRGLIA